MLAGFDNPSNKNSADSVTFSQFGIDDREQLCNDGLIGPINQVSLAKDVITSLRGIMLDFDPDRLRTGRGPNGDLIAPDLLYQQIQPMLSRHPVFANAEVRGSRGLHVVIWFNEPVIFNTEEDRRRWGTIVRLVQRLLPTDPNCPGITASTRPLGCINGKNGAVVRRLHQGKAVRAAEVVELFERACSSPFRTICQLLFGTDRVRPCPICNCADTCLDAADLIGRCYGRCGKVSIGKLFDVFVAPRPAKNAK